MRRCVVEGQDMYAFTLFLHSWLRWLVLAVGVAHGVRSFVDWRRGCGWSAGRSALRAAAVGLMDLQVLLGLLLYFALSPLSQAAVSDVGGAMKDPALRFFGVEHIATMLLATLVMHIGQARGKRRQTPARHRTLFLTQALWLLLVLASIPWPMLDIGRPLFRPAPGFERRLTEQPAQHVDLHVHPRTTAFKSAW